ncbi:MAG: T9SS type A sorting domain-containing protein, partial [Elusimicrobiota bacterium]|nr:T9SS type A sorting domain-containing protein [Elusimicrobiota bacterium]
PEGNAGDILTETVKITRAAGESVEPIYALERPTGIEDNELMVKFNADEVKAVLIERAELNLVVAGELTDGKKFEGNDTFRTIGNYIPASERKNFRYMLKGNISDGASIVRARVVMNYASKNRAHLLNARGNSGKWSSKLNRNSSYGYLPANGEKYEWEVTPTVSSSWENGEEYVEIVIDYDSSEIRGQPCLVVTYSDGTVQKIKNAEPVGPAVSRGDSQGKVKLYYTGEDAAKYKKASLKIYGWNTITKNWEPVSGTVNDGDNALSTADTSYPIYSIMSVTPSSGDTRESSKNRLGQNYPNPFNPGTTIKYSIDSDAHVTIKLFNIRGQKVATLVNEYKSAGNHSVYFGDGEKLSRGVYYYQIRAGDFVSTKRMVVLH